MGNVGQAMKNLEFSIENYRFYWPAKRAGHLERNLRSNNFFFVPELDNFSNCLLFDCVHFPFNRIHTSGRIRWDTRRWW